jgi:hypothetical protein
MNKGFVLLYIVLIFASLAVAAALSAGNSGFFAASRTRSLDANLQIRMAAMSCAETLLMQMRQSPGSTSSGSMSVMGGTCTYSITGSMPTKTITLAVTIGNLYSRIGITTSQINPTITATWQEKAN